MKKIAIIGGTGLENPDILNNPENITLDTPYGKPSSDFLMGTIGEVKVVMLSRHGRKHEIPPSKVNNRANIWAIKELGCSHIIATTACGSLREEIGRGDFVFPNQFIDFTKHRALTFFDEFKDGQLKHTAMPDPFSELLRNVFTEAANKLKFRYHPKGTVITIEGPRFSTRAESHMFRLWGADIINMSTAPEAILANELQIPYAVIAVSTDYDCWKNDEEPASWEEIVYVFNNNVEKLKKLIIKILPEI